MRNVFLCLAVFFSFAAHAKIKVVTTLPDLAWVAREIGKENVEVRPLLTGKENPHYVDTVPEFVRQVANANVVCIVGLDLEIGWMPKVLTRSGNAQVQPGGKGYCETGKAVTVLEKPTGPVDRTMGDIHPSGNPHFWLSPKALAEAAKPIADTLASVDPAHAADYMRGLTEVKAKLEAVFKENQGKLAPFVAKFKGPFLIEYHKEFSYFLDVYGLKSLGSIEEKPGIPPSAGRLAEVAIAAKSAGIRTALAGDSAPKHTLERFKELSGVSIVSVPTSTQAKGELSEYPRFQAHLVDSLVKSLHGTGTP